MPEGREAGKLGGKKAERLGGREVKKLRSREDGEGSGFEYAYPSKLLTF
jgi:hypothetical protein